MRKTTKYLVNWLSLYEMFPDKETVSKEQFRLILRLFHNLVYREIVDGRFIKFPHAAGVLGIYRNKSQATDYALLNKQNIRSPQRNLHTDGYVAAAVWQKGLPVYMRGTMRFKFKRQQARRFAQFLKTGADIYKYRERHEKHFN